MPRELTTPPVTKIYFMWVKCRETPKKIQRRAKILPFRFPPPGQNPGEKRGRGAGVVQVGRSQRHAESVAESFRDGREY